MFISAKPDSLSVVKVVLEYPLTCFKVVFALACVAGGIVGLKWLGEEDFFQLFLPKPFAAVPLVVAASLLACACIKTLQYRQLRRLVCSLVVG